MMIGVLVIAALFQTDSLRVPTAGVQRVELHSRQPGSITIVGSDRSDALITWNRGRVRFRTEQQGPMLQVIEDRSSPGAQDSIRLVIRLPKSLAVSVWNREARVQLAHIDGNIWVNSNNGPVVVDTAGGAVQLKVVNGSAVINAARGAAVVNTMAADIRLLNVVGAAAATSVSGKVEINGVAGDSLFVSTTTGDLSLQGRLPGRVLLESHEGSISLQFAPSASATLLMSTIDGRIRNAFSPEQAYPRNQQHRIQLGSGSGPSINGATFRGNIEIRRQ